MKHFMTGFTLVPLKMVTVVNTVSYFPRSPPSHHPSSVALPLGITLCGNWICTIRDATSKYTAVRSASATNISDTYLLKLLKSKKTKEESDIDRNRAYIGTLISSTFFIVRKRWALDSVNDFISFVDEIGCPSVNEYLARNPTTRYTSSTAVTDLLDCINLFFEDALLKRVRECDFFSLLADESSDEANKTQFAILIRCLIDKSVDDHLLGLINVSRTDAATLMGEIERFLLAKGVDISKAMFVGFDGCNTMSGENKGTSTFFFSSSRITIGVCCLLKLIVSQRIVYAIKR